MGGLHSLLQHKFAANLRNDLWLLSQVCGLRNALGALCSQVQRAQRAERRSQGLRLRSGLFQCAERLWHCGLGHWRFAALTTKAFTALAASIDATALRATAAG